MIVGHELIIQDLTRLADRRQLPHGLLFFGPRRTGKRLVATALGHYLEHGKFKAEHIALSDTLVLAPNEEGTIGVDEARALQRFLSLRPNVSPYRTAIVDGAEALSAEAQNALLKITEEPPESALIILIASDPEVLLPTLRSRLQRFYFGSASSSSIASWLERSCKAPSAKAREAASASRGIPGLAWAMLFDPQMDSARKQAKAFLESALSARKELVKEMSADESFRIDAFLEALLLVLAPSARAHPVWWHRVAGLRGDAARFNLNPRLQLTSLAYTLE